MEVVRTGEGTVALDKGVWELLARVPKLGAVSSRRDSRHIYTAGCSDYVVELGLRVAFHKVRKRAREVESRSPLSCLEWATSCCPKIVCLTSPDQAPSHYGSGIELPEEGVHCRTRRIDAARA
jgi:hypothetical protein